jgi:hypothetical protein
MHALPAWLGADSVLKIPARALNVGQECLKNVLNALPPPKSGPSI